MACTVEVSLKPGFVGRSVPVDIGSGQIAIVGFEPGVAVQVPGHLAGWFRASQAYQVGSAHSSSVGFKPTGRRNKR